MVKKDDYVLIHYTGKFDDGEVFDSSEERQPFEFRVGSNSVIPGMDNAMIGMEINQEKSIKLPPNEAYGEYDEAMIYNFPIEDIKKQFEPEIGMVIGVQMENGNSVPARIKEITGTDVFIDMNHPLAGKTLNFNIKLLEINSEPKHTSSGCDCCGSAETDCSC
jgi:peptidylprolyl isomerase